MNLTQKKISEYKAKLPKAKEKFIAMLLLLILSASMLTTVSFAWLSLSTNPEISNISTAIAANGNLEIALASGIRVPGSTQLGDGDLALTDKNITWGNLVNLADPSYGLSNMVLRPALLNKGQLATNPLRAAVYTADGRFDSLSTDFGYAKWHTYTDGREGGIFELTDEYGLRAITSTKYEVDLSGFNFKQDLMYKDMVNANNEAKTAYMAIVQNKSYMNSLAVLMGSYMTARMNSDDASLSNPTIESEDIQNLMLIFRDFSAALEKERQYMLVTANYQIFLQQPYIEGVNSATITVDEMMSKVSEQTKNGTNTFTAAGVQISIFGLGSNKRDKRIIDEGYEKLLTLSTQGDLKWVDSGLNNIVNSLITVGLCTIEGTPINNIGASAAMNYLNKTNNAEINDGVLYNFEGRTGAAMDVKGLSIEAKVKRYGITVPGTVKANITTSADHVENGFVKDTDHTDALLATARENPELGGAPSRMADETYGFVIDFWVRTNAMGSFLTLEGNVLTETHYEDAKGKDPEGNEVQLYTVSESTGESVGGIEIPLIRDVYMKTAEMNATFDASGNLTELLEPEAGVTGTHIVEYWFYYENHNDYPHFRLKAADGTVVGWYTPVYSNGVLSFTKETAVKDPVFKINEYEVVIGYEGENRVWDEGDGSFISINSTTQGSGSCYVFYADTPEDQDRGLKLLGSLKIAFVDKNGTLLAEAYLDAERFYSDSGKIIVPLVLASDSISLGTDASGKEKYAITQLTQNEATLISAIVYLDGQQLTNQDVLATSDIEGQFNIQFGSSAPLEPVSNDQLEEKELVVSASVDKNTFNYDTDSNLTVKVTANIDGIEPSRVEAFFVRTITSTQGVPLDVFSFAKQGDGTWIANYTFSGPGDYVLRSIRIDGVEYDLAVDSRPTVAIAGFGIQSVSWDVGGSYHRFLSSAGAVSTGVTVKFNAGAARQPSSVVGLFHSASGQTASVNFGYNATSTAWRGNISFAASGEYVLDMLLIDGEYFSIDASQRKTAEVIVGIRAAITTSSPNKFVYGLGADNDVSTGDVINGAQTGMYDNEWNLKMRLQLVDNSGKPLEALSGVHLSYGRKSYVSTVVGMSADMRWNGTGGYYEGQMESKPGTFEFIEVTIQTDNGTNTITSYTTAPVFSIDSPYPPSIAFETGQTTTSKQYKPNADDPGVLSVPLKETNSDTIVTAVVQKQDAAGNWVEYKEIKVTGAEGINGGDGANYNVWQFKITENGTYRITSLKFNNVYVDGRQIGEDDEPYVIELNSSDQEKLHDSTTANILISIDATVTPTVNLGGTSIDNATALFLSEQTLSGIELRLNGDNKPLLGATNVILTYEYQYDPQNYGGYSYKKEDVVAVYNGTLSIAMEDLDNDGVYTMTGASNLTYAGTYKLVGISFTSEYKQDGSISLQSASTIAVYSKRPTVNITDVSSNSGSSGTNTFDATSATVYFNTGTASTGGCRPTEYTTYTAPTVSLTLGDIGGGSSASLTIGDVSYTWNGNGTSTKSIGRVNGSGQSQSKVTAGTDSAEQLIVESNGISFTVTIPTITINNPA